MFSSDLQEVFLKKLVRYFELSQPFNNKKTKLQNCKFCIFKPIQTKFINANDSPIKQIPRKFYKLNSPAFILFLIFKNYDYNHTFRWANINEKKIEKSDLLYIAFILLR